MSNAYAIRGGADKPDAKTFGRWTRPALIALAAVCAVVLAGRFGAVPLMEIRHVVVRSDVPLTDEQVLSISGIQGTEHWYSLRAAVIEKRLEANPLVRRALVQKAFPDTVRMTVWGRQPVALVLAESAGRSLPVLVDGEGIVFKLGTTSAEVDLPVISGLLLGETSLGAQLPRAYGSLFADMKTLRERSPSLFSLVSEVRVVPTSGASGVPASSADFDLLLYLTNSPVPVRISGGIDENLLKYTLMVLDLLSKQGVLKDIQELDFRSGDVVYRLHAPGAVAAHDAPGAVVVDAPITVAGASAPGAAAANAPGTGADVKGG
jgi:cell division protein FtsQ